MKEVICVQAEKDGRTGGVDSTIACVSRPTFARSVNEMDVRIARERDGSAGVVDDYDFPVVIGLRFETVQGVYEEVNVSRPNRNDDADCRLVVLAHGVRWLVVSRSGERREWM